MKRGKTNEKKEKHGKKLKKKTKMKKIDDKKRPNGGVSPETAQKKKKYKEL